MRAGDLVEVRSVPEILATLDGRGELERLPFMEEMIRYSGQRFRIASIAHKTCDTIHKTGGRAMRDTVHLAGLECDGAKHDGCQASCPLFWKKAWLKPAPATAAANSASAMAAPAAGSGMAAGSTIPARSAATAASSAGCTLEQLAQAARTLDPATNKVRYSCQTTRLFAATEPLPWWNPAQYVRDFTSGNHSFGTVVRTLLLSWMGALTRVRWGYSLFRRLYDLTHRALFGTRSVEMKLANPIPSPTPRADLDLAPGECVQVKPADAILATLDARMKNRGMWFDVEATAFCGKQFRVERRVERLIDERTGEMIEMKTPAVILEGVRCPGRYSTTRLLCPRAIPPYWREIWLQRVPQPPPQGKTG